MGRGSDLQPHAQGKISGLGSRCGSGPQRGVGATVQGQERDQKVLNFKGTVIKGWTGLYEAKLPEPYFRLAYDAGFGAKNPQGFGMVGVVR